MQESVFKLPFLYKVKHPGQSPELCKLCWGTSVLPLDTESRTVADCNEFSLPKKLILLFTSHVSNEQKTPVCKLLFL